MKRLALTDAEEPVGSQKMPPKVRVGAGPSGPGIEPSEARKQVNGFKQLMQSAAKIEAKRRMKNKK